MERSSLSLCITLQVEDGAGEIGGDMQFSQELLLGEVL